MQTSIIYYIWNIEGFSPCTLFGMISPRKPASNVIVRGGGGDASQTRHIHFISLVVTGHEEK